jgi:hypothetical protein
MTMMHVTPPNLHPWRQPDVASIASQALQYAIVFEAGSSSTSAYVYEYTPSASRDAYPAVKSEESPNSIRGGIENFAYDPKPAGSKPGTGAGVSLEPLCNWTRSKVRNAAVCTVWGGLMTVDGRMQVCLQTV